MLYWCALLSFLSSSAYAQGPQLDLYDVSVLLPRPNAQNAIDSNLYLKANFPLALLNQAESALLPADQPNETTHDQLRAVAFRLDLLEQEFRIVWQPFSDGKPAQDLDGAVHTIYPVSKNELRVLSEALHRERGLNAQNASVDEASFLLNPIHPELRQGLSSEFYRKFLKLIEPYIQFSKMKKIAVFGVRGNANGWIFGALDRDPKNPAQFIPNQIPNTMQKDGTLLTKQNLVNFTPEKGFNIGMFLNEIFGQNQVNLAKAPERSFLRDSDAFLAARSKEQLNRVYANLFQLNSPKVANVRNTDCFTCHTIDSAIAVIDREKGNQHSDTVARIPGNLRAFGYFRGVPSITKRTIVDSLESLKAAAHESK